MQQKTFLCQRSICFFCSTCSLSRRGNAVSNSRGLWLLGEMKSACVDNLHTLFPSCLSNAVHQQVLLISPPKCLSNPLLVSPAIQSALSPPVCDPHCDGFSTQLVLLPPPAKRDRDRALCAPPPPPLAPPPTLSYSGPVTSSHPTAALFPPPASPHPPASLSPCTFSRFPCSQGFALVVPASGILIHDWASAHTSFSCPDSAPM